MATTYCSSPLLIFFILPHHIQIVNFYQYTEFFPSPFNPFIGEKKETALLEESSQYHKGIKVRGHV